MPRLECLSLIEQLKLNTMYKHFKEIVTDGVKRKRSTLDILHRLLTIEQIDRNICSIEYRINQAKFPYHKSLADFEFKKTPLNKPAIELFLDNLFIENNRNIIFVGGPGTGKTHLATVISINATTECKKIRFWNVLDLVNKLEVDKESQQYKLSNQLMKYYLIILD